MILIREFGEQHGLDPPFRQRGGDVQDAGERGVDGDPSAGGPRPRGAAAGGEGSPVAEVDPAPRERVPRRGPPRGAGAGRAAGEQARGAHAGHDRHQEVVLQLRPRSARRHRHGRMEMQGNL